MQCPPRATEEAVPSKSSRSSRSPRAVLSVGSVQPPDSRPLQQTAHFQTHSTLPWVVLAPSSEVPTAPASLFPASRGRRYFSRGSDCGKCHPSGHWQIRSPEPAAASTHPSKLPSLVQAHQGGLIHTRHCITRAVCGEGVDACQTADPGRMSTTPKHKQPPPSGSPPPCFSATQGGKLRQSCQVSRPFAWLGAMTLCLAGQTGCVGWLQGPASEPWRQGRNKTMGMGSHDAEGDEGTEYSVSRSS